MNKTAIYKALGEVESIALHDQDLWEALVWRQRVAPMHRVQAIVAEVARLMEFTSAPTTDASGNDIRIHAWRKIAAMATINLAQLRHEAAGDTSE